MRDRNHLSEGQLHALVSLLDDRDEGIVRTCSRRLEDEGPRVLDVLERVPPDRKVLRERAARVALGIRAAEEERSLRRWLQGDGDLDLETGALWLARVREPGADVSATRDRLDQLAVDLDADIPDPSEPDDIADALVRTLAEVEGLNGNRSDYYDPENSFLDLVLERSVGIPISLSVVYVLVGRRLGLPVHGVGMPGHFIVQCGEADPIYLDPFDGGRRLTREACLQFLAREGFGASESFLSVPSDRRILARMIGNLVHSYRRLDEPELEGRYGRLFEAASGEPPPA
ncbi:MAG: SirB1 family protein [Planctomycetota bacterium JB042]